MNHEIRRAFYASLPLMLGFTPLAMILGAQASQQGQSALTAYLMTAINLAGGSEFAAVSLWQHPVPPILMIVISTFLINSRHIILGATLAPYVRQESGLRIFFLYFVMCDETWALSMQEMERRQAQNLGFNFVYHMAVGIFLWADWSLSAFLGALIGNTLGDLNHYGFSVALPATFIGLTVAMRPKKDYIKYLPIAVSFAGSALCALFISPTYSVGLGAVVGLTTAYFIQVIKEKNDPNFKEGELKEVDLRQDSNNSHKKGEPVVNTKTALEESEVSKTIDALNDIAKTHSDNPNSTPPSSSSTSPKGHDDANAPSSSWDRHEANDKLTVAEGLLDQPNLALATAKEGK